MRGFTGSVGFVDLSRMETRVETPPWEFYRKLLGGRNFVLNYLLEIPSSVDPLGPENRIIVATSPLTSTGFPGTSRFSIGCKSPLTGGFGEGEAGGWFGPELQRAGFDALVVDGVSEEPVYLWISDGAIEIRSANGVWGLETAEAHAELLSAVDSDSARIALIGPAGEMLVRFACIASDLRNFCGRGGMGAVWGSKKLKAIVAKGSAPPEMADQDGLRSLTKWFQGAFEENPGLSLKGKIGTMFGVQPMSEMGLLPTRNFTAGSFAEAHCITGETLVETTVREREGCRACPVRCKRVVTGAEFDHRYGGPEFESIGSLGSNCGIGNPDVIVKANERCNALGLDTISTGVTVAFAMECGEAGLLGKFEHEGEALRFGNGQALLDVCELIARRDGLGDILAEGSVRAAEAIGHGSIQFAMAVKGLEIPAHDPRGKWGVGLGYAVSPTGADHLQAAHDTWFERTPQPELESSYVDVSDLWPFGVYEPMPGPTLGREKVKAFVPLQKWWSLHNVLDVCIFVSTPEYRLTGLDKLCQLVSHATGWNVLDSELLRAGELGVTMARIFNIREGFSEAQDELPLRFHQDLPHAGGAHPGIPRSDLQEALLLYYGLLGWSSNGTPTAAKCEELGIYQDCKRWGFKPAGATGILQEGEG